MASRQTVTRKTQIQTNNDCIYNNYIQCYSPNSPTRSTHITLPEHSSTNAHFLGCSTGHQAFRKSWPPTLHHVCNRPVLMRYRFSSRSMGTSDRKIGRWNQQVLVSPTGYFHWPSGRDRYFSISLLITVDWGVLSHTPVASATHGINYRIM